MKLNLENNNPSEVIIKNYLESNASETLAEKINNGVKIEKDGKVLLNKKTIASFMNYAHEEAKKLAEKGAKFACIDRDTVFGWAIHYFEEDSIEGILYNEDGTEYKPAKPTIAKPVMKPSAPPKPKVPSLLDLLQGDTKPVVTQNIKVDPSTGEVLEMNTNEIPTFLVKLFGDEIKSEVG